MNFAENKCDRSANTCAKPNSLMSPIWVRPHKIHFVQKEVVFCRLSVLLNDHACDLICFFLEGNRELSVLLEPVKHKPKPDFSMRTMHDEMKVRYFFFW